MMNKLQNNIIKEYKKMGVSHLTKTFFISVVSEESFNNSLKIESAGFFDVFKIGSKEELDFRIMELKKLGYCEEND